MRTSNPLVLAAAALLVSSCCKKSPPPPVDTAPAAQTGSSSAVSTPSSSPAPARPPRKLYDRDLASACNEMPEPRAAVYDASKGGLHPLVVFSRTDENQKFIKSYSSDYKPWEASDPSAYELVACVTMKTSTKVRECKFDDKKPARFLDMNDATFEIRIHEASTGKRIAAKDAALKALNRCPTIWMFRSEHDVSNPDFSQAVINLARPLVQAK